MTNNDEKVNSFVQGVIDKGGGIDSEFRGVLTMLALRSLNKGTKAPSDYGDKYYGGIVTRFNVLSYLRSKGFEGKVTSNSTIAFGECRVAINRFGIVNEVGGVENFHTFGYDQDIFIRAYLALSRAVVRQDSLVMKISAVPPEFERDCVCLSYAQFSICPNPRDIFAGLFQGRFAFARLHVPVGYDFASPWFDSCRVLPCLAEGIYYVNYSPMPVVFNVAKTERITYYVRFSPMNPYIQNTLSVNTVFHQEQPFDLHTLFVDVHYSGGDIPMRTRSILHLTVANNDTELSDTSLSLLESTLKLRGVEVDVVLLEGIGRTPEWVFEYLKTFRVGSYVVHLDQEVDSLWVCCFCDNPIKVALTCVQHSGGHYSIMFSGFQIFVKSKVLASS